MLRKLQTKREEGFTIIEVLIVLAIAGLIMLIVFLAVPALQRNSRNTQRKNDVSNLLGAVSEYTSNNGGRVPTVNSQITGNTSLSFYDPAQVSVVCLQAMTAATASTACSAATYTVSGTTPSENNVQIVYGAKCGAGPAPTTTGASIRNIAVMYRVEASSGAGQVVCTES